MRRRLLLPLLMALVGAAAPLAAADLAPTRIRLIRNPADVPWGGHHRFAVTDYSGGKVLVFSADGRLEWQHPAENANDLSVLPSDHLLFNTGHGVQEVDREGNVVFEYRSTSDVYACQRLPDGNTLVGECSGARLLEVSPKGEIVKQLRLLPQGQDGGSAFMRNARKLANGHYLVAHYGANVVREYDGAGRVVLEIPAPGGPHSVERLPDGHTMFSCGDHDGGQGIFEADGSGRIVWSVREGDLAGVSLKFVAGFQRLANGHTVIANWLGHGQLGQAPHLVEITRDKHVVWTYADSTAVVTVSNIRFLDNRPPDWGKARP